MLMSSISCPVSPWRCNNCRWCDIDWLDEYVESDDDETVAGLFDDGFNEPEMEEFD